MKYILSFYLLVAVSAQSATWFVSGNGNNLDGTTWTKAWDAPESVVWTSINPGDIILIDGGPISMTYEKKFTIPASVDGTLANPITIKRTTEADHNGVVTFLNGFVMLGDYFIIDGLDWNKLIVPSANPVHSATIAMGVGDPPYQELDGRGCQIRNMHLEGNATSPFGWEASAVKTYAPDLLIHRINFDKSPGEDHLKIVAHGNITVEYCWFHDLTPNPDTAVHSDCLVEFQPDVGFTRIYRFNIFSDSNTDTMLAVGNGAGGTFLIYGNVWDNVFHGPHIGVGFTSLTYVLYNNVFNDCTAGATVLRGHTASIWNNIFSGSTGNTPASQSHSGLWETGVPGYPGGDDFQGDPDFADDTDAIGPDLIVGTADDGFLILTGSLAKDNGTARTDYSGVDKDMIGTMRPFGADWDIGAYEFTGGSPSAPILNSATNATAVNGVPFSYQMTAMNGVDNWGASNLPPDLVFSGTTGLINGNPNDPSPPTEYQVTLLATNATGDDVLYLWINVLAAAADIQLIATNTTFSEILVSSTYAVVVVVSNKAGVATTLSGHATNETSPFVIVGNRDYELAGETSTNITVRFTPMSVGLFDGSIDFTGGIITTNLEVMGSAYPLLESPWSATNGLIVGPTVWGNTDHWLYATVQTLGDNRGRAVYGFELEEDSMIRISAIVWATNEANNSFFIGVDMDPEFDSMIWDIVSLATNEEKFVSWRGPTGTSIDPNFETNVWSLDAGLHKLVIQSREANTYISNIWIRLEGMPDLPSMAAKATNSLPVHMFMNVDVNDDLVWFAGDGALTHDVYFGTDSTPDSGEFQGNQVGLVFDPGLLVAGVEYFWRIDEVNAAGTTTGDIWKFTTLEAEVPEPPSGLRVRNAFNRTTVFTVTGQ